MHINVNGEPLAPAGSDGGRESGPRRVPGVEPRARPRRSATLKRAATTVRGFQRGTSSTPCRSATRTATSRRRRAAAAVLAVGGMLFFHDPSMTVNGRQFSQAVEADLVFADGWDACTMLRAAATTRASRTWPRWRRTSSGTRLGLGHSGGLHGRSGDWTRRRHRWRRFAHFDGRSASLHADDKARRHVHLSGPHADHP